MTGLAYLLNGKIYDFLDGYFEKIRYERIRKEVIHNLNGKILDAGQEGIFLIIENQL